MLLTCLLIGVILSYVTVTVPVVKMYLQRRWPGSGSTVVSKPGAAFQIAMWGLAYVAFLYFNKADPAIVPP